MSSNENNNTGKILVGWEIFIPMVFIIVAGVFLIVYLRFVEACWETQLVPILFALAFGGFGLWSLSFIEKTWEYRQQRWMEEQANNERKELRKAGESLNEKVVALEQKYQLKQKEAYIELLKKLAELKPENPDPEKDKDYLELYKLMKDNITALIKEHFKQIEDNTNQTS